MLRRLYKDQPESFAFTPANQAWAEAQIAKYPAGREASAIIPLLWRAQEQEGWLSRPAIEHVADLLGLAYIRALEVATFYFMFQLQPVGSVAHLQICGTTSCMICGSEDLMEVCKKKIAPHPHELSADGKFSWEEVECLGACANAPMAQIGKDYYEDLTQESLAALIDEMAAGGTPLPGSRAGRYSSEPLGGPTSLADWQGTGANYNASVQRAVDLGDQIRRIDGTEEPLHTPWLEKGLRHQPPGTAPEETQEAPAESGAVPAPETSSADAAAKDAPTQPVVSEGKPVDRTGVSLQESEEISRGRPDSKSEPSVATAPGGTAAAEPGQNVGPIEDEPGGAAATEDAAPATGSLEVAGAAGNGSAKPGSAAPAASSAAAGAPMAPQGIAAPRDGRPDDLKIIEGIGPVLERLCHDLGIWHFDQIAGWSEQDVAWMDGNLPGFRGRVTRDRWVAQARLIGEIGPEEFLRRAAKNEY